MATASVSQEDRKGKEAMDEFMTCSICAESYDGGAHQAKLLSCFHTFCKSCLQSVACESHVFDCPKCCKLTNLPLGQTVASLPNNFIVENIIAYRAIFSEDILCGNCDDDYSAVKFCYDCRSFQCQSCVESHQKLRFLHQHELVTIEELKAKKCNPRMQQKQFCKQHPRQELNLFCNSEDCKILVCASCGLVDHKNHDLVHVRTHITKVVSAMRQSSERVRNKCRELHESSAKAERVQKALHNHFACKYKNIQKFEQELTQAVTGQCSKARSHLKLLYAAERNKLVKRKESVDNVSAQMTSACDFADRSCDMSQTVVQFMSSGKQIKQVMGRLSQLEAVEPLPDTAFDKIDFVFTEKHQLAMTQILESIQDIGDIMCKPQIDPQRSVIQLNLDSGKKRYQKIGIFQAVNRSGEKVSIDDNNIEIKQDEEILCALQDSNISEDLYRFHYHASYDSAPLNVKINGTLMKGSPFNTQPGVDPKQCTIELGRLRCRNDRRKKATVQLVDHNGDKFKGSAKVKAVQGRTSLGGHDNKDGTYMIPYISGCNSKPLHVTINGAAMRRSPFSTIPEADPQRCTIRLGLTLPSSHECYEKTKRNTFAIVQLVDFCGDKMTFSNGEVEASQGECTLQVRNNNDGSYTFYYVSSYTSSPVHVEINGTEMEESPFNSSGLQLQVLVRPPINFTKPNSIIK